MAVAALLPPSPFWQANRRPTNGRTLFTLPYVFDHIFQKITFKENPSSNGQIKVTSSVFNSKNTLLNHLLIAASALRNTNVCLKQSGGWGVAQSKPKHHTWFGLRHPKHHYSHAEGAPQAPLGVGTNPPQASLSRAPPQN